MQLQCAAVKKTNEKSKNIISRKLNKIYKKKKFGVAFRSQRGISSLSAVCCTA